MEERQGDWAKGRLGDEEKREERQGDWARGRRREEGKKIRN